MVTDLYPFDPIGNANTNLIKDEEHVLTRQNDRDYHFIVPKLAPFYSDTIKIKLLGIDGSLNELKLGRDYHLTHKFVTASRSIAKADIVGSITFLDNELIGVIVLEYQCLGGDWSVNTDEITRVLSSTQKNPRITTWENVVQRPTTFPVVNHNFDVINLRGTEALIDSIDRLGISLIEYITNTQGYTNDQINRLLSNKLERTGTAANSFKLNGKTEFDIINSIKSILNIELAKVNAKVDTISNDYATKQELNTAVKRLKVFSLTNGG